MRVFYSGRLVAMHKYKNIYIYNKYNMNIYNSFNTEGDIR